MFVAYDSSVRILMNTMESQMLLSVHPSMLHGASFLRKQESMMLLCFFVLAAGWYLLLLDSCFRWNDWLWSLFGCCKQGCPDVLPQTDPEQ